ncbi:hypothetical protein [Pseudoroseomonas cervicalis]|uniref:hypothetical protein n=1 Tax=Teichococcus cervicalis TaxID=204525 RepID=UPI0022F168E0|nr:hypothetical protein [Pseudoroseomonas cervicalis]WBV44044.1 hypothetical protein PFY06_05610 [Pseudoroseomonas cervicalis]
MQPRMSATEQALFASLLRCSDAYFEFGCGGSTYLAVQSVRHSVVSVESDPAWIAQVEAACAALPAPRATLETIRVDIGPTGAWGRPVGTAHRRRWPDYHRQPIRHPAAHSADLYLVDGRFRVACFLQVLLHAPPQALVMLHDYASRPHYHAIEAVAREVARAEDLSVFQPRRGVTRRSLRGLLARYRLEPE